MSNTLQGQDRKKNRPQHGRASEDAIINFQLTNQLMLGSYYKKNLSQMSTQVNKLNRNFCDDDLVYSDNENEQPQESTPVEKLNFSSKKTNSQPAVQSSSQNVLLDRSNIQVSNQKNQKKLFKVKTQEQQLINQNKSCCFTSNRSVFFRKQRTNNLGIFFRIKERPNIRSIVQNAYKTQRKNR